MHTLQRLATILIAILIAIMLVWYWRIGTVVFSGHITETNHLRTVALVIAYFILNIAAIIGLLQLKSWRTIVSCIAIIFSTLFFSTAYIPFLTHLIAKSYHPYLMIVGNIIVFLCVIFTHKGRG
jgi:hypothetical protein